MNLVCYICKEDFKDADLTLPINIDVTLPFGRFAVTIFYHYLCGLKYYMETLEGMVDLMEKDRLVIEALLMDTLSSMRKGNIH